MVQIEYFYSNFFIFYNITNYLNSRQSQINHPKQSHLKNKKHNKLIETNMGSICTNNNHQKQQTTETVDSRNSVKISVSLGNHCSIDLITGNFRQCKSDSLLIITELKSLDHCDALRQYCQQPEKVIEKINAQRKMFQKAAVNKLSPYKRILFAIMPRYCTEQSQEYQQHFRNILKEVMASSKQITVEFSNTNETINHQLPNQMLLAIMFKQLQEVRNNVKINLISQEKKMTNMYKYELLKTEKCNLNQGF